MEFPPGLRYESATHAGAPVTLEDSGLGSLPPSGWAGRTFASLRHHNFRVYFLGQLVSLIGSWMQSAAQSWLVYDLTGSKAMLGLVGVAGTAPMLLSSMWGGALADRLPRRRILVWTQVGLALPSLALALLVLTGWLQVWHIVAIALASGAVIGFDMPARQAFVVDLAGRADLMNAIALNSSAFNGARIVGPAVAGVLIGWVGPGWCFLGNGLSFVAPLAALLSLRLLPRPDEDRRQARRGPLDGFRIVAATPGVVWLMGILLVMGVFGWSYVVLMPAFARDVLGVGPEHYGALMSAHGAGSVVGALGVASARRRRTARRIVPLSVLIFAVFTYAFSFARDFHVALALLALSGFGMTAFFSAVNTLVQLSVADHQRGRVMGVYSFVFGLMMPMGAAEAGGLAQSWGAPATVRLGAAACALAALVYLLGTRVASRRDALQPPGPVSVA
jgi:MFS family permease